MIDEKKVYNELWEIINANIVTDKLGRPHWVKQGLPKELIDYILKLLKKEGGL